MKNLFLILAGVAFLTAAAANAVINPQGAVDKAHEAIAEKERRNDDNLPPRARARARAAGDTVTLHPRECEISCPVNLYWCRYAPYNYKCDRNGKLQRDRRSEDCEQARYGCWCGCDWRAPGIEKKDGPASAAEVFESE
ncbi:hypothetical protein CTA2_10586 [Colletotrichum tanaceti]|uniref:Uncharacterized protein n=1 Tax=Colletotrichum tanaceti TaxID=1306861 RepID=A0A4U6XNC0_9PEZI|nr:hypothetical protein CTA2_10586 [Colletotrichum tanaceti]TKW57201.1 hypothetical protein CTA1_6647 [Colletotrichum tanaceti]